jgi:hypothetical protein
MVDVQWDLTSRDVVVGPGEFNEIIENPPGNGVTGGGYAFLNPDGTWGKPIANVVQNGPNGSGSWRVRGTVDQEIKLHLYIMSVSGE